MIERLTPRELAIFDMVAHGKKNKQIAFILKVSERTVKEHRRRVMKKLELKTSAHLVHLASQLGRIDHG